jgi:hypothetical protein
LWTCERAGRADIALDHRPAERCSSDCHCGNKVCNTDFGENGDNCASDCKCSDGACDARETKDSCPVDC